MENCDDGFELANRDLEIRGGGSVFTTRQSGFIDFKIADIKDIEAVKKAQSWASWCIENDVKIKELEVKMTEYNFTSHLE
jgi:ATP-dependent DNA helicase RecG